MKLLFEKWQTPPGLRSTFIYQLIDGCVFKRESTVKFEVEQVSIGIEGGHFIFKLLCK